MQVLLVEDDLLLGEGIVHALKQAGFTANWIVSGTHALNEIKAKAPDILLLDPGVARYGRFKFVKNYSRPTLGYAHLNSYSKR